MSQRKGGLGRGLGALIPSGPAPSNRPGEPTSAGDQAGAEHESATSTPSPPSPADSAPGTGAYFREIPVDAIVANPRQPRQHFDPEALSELVSSITEVGLLQPIVVRPLGDERFELVMGERRLRASRQAGLAAIPAIVRETAEADRLRDALLENLHRQALNPLEEAAAYAQLLEDFGATHEELAARIGRSRSQVSNTIRLLNLPPAVQRRVAAGVLSAGHARALLGLEDAGQQEALASRIVAEGMSVRAVEETVHLTGTAPADGPGRRAARRPLAQAPGAEALADRLADYFETRVSVALGRRRGKVVIEFASVDDLERIVTLISPALAGSAEGDQPAG